MSAASEVKKQYYEEMNLFRGFAIYSIIFGHCMRMIYYKYTTEPWKGVWGEIWQYFSLVFSPGGTWFFVFISGFLFYAVFYQRGFNYKNFIKDKLKKVLLPYLIYVSGIILLNLIYYPPSKFTFLYFYNFFFWYSFWYIPFIMCMFLISPFFISLLDISFRKKIYILGAMTIVAVTLGRHLTSPVLSCLLFLPCYFLGIICAMYYHKFQEIPSNLRWSFLYIAIALTTVLKLCGYWKEPHDSIFSPLNMNVLVKLCFCLLYVYMFLWLKNSGHNFIKWILNILSKYSFTLFFFQQFPVFFLEHHLHKEFFARSSNIEILLIGFAASIIFCGGTILIFAPIKKLLGRYSRMIIGS